MKTYRAYGLNIASEVSLPELPLAEGVPDVEIRRSSIGAPWDRDPGIERIFQKTAEGILLTWNQFGRFLIRNGCEILFEGVPVADETFVRHLILGPVLCVLNFQRGLLVFHASAIALPSGGVAFMAGSGYGKSTQAAAFVRRGRLLITDDVLLLKVEQTTVWAMPGVPFLKLWPETLAMIGENPDEHPLVKTNMPKRTLSKTDTSLKEPVALRAVFLLDHGPEIKIDLISPKDALRWIMQNWYGVLFQGELLPILGLERQFRDCTMLIQNIPVYRLRRPASLDLLPAICEAVECSV